MQVDLCSNTVKKYDLTLVVDVEGVGDAICSLPIGARCVVPQITVLTPILDYGRCFLRHPYEHHVKLQNDTELPAKYELLPQQADDYTPILYTSPQPKVHSASTLTRSPRYVYPLHHSTPQPDVRHPLNQRTAQGTHILYANT